MMTMTMTLFVVVVHVLYVKMNKIDKYIGHEYISYTQHDNAILKHNTLNRCSASSNPRT
jgi:hypothetical protein